jgi:hypothetical protein
VRLCVKDARIEAWQRGARLSGATRFLAEVRHGAERHCGAKQCLHEIATQWLGRSEGWCVTAQLDFLGAKGGAQSRAE